MHVQSPLCMSKVKEHTGHRTVLTCQDMYLYSTSIPKEHTSLHFKTHHINNWEDIPSIQHILNQLAALIFPQHCCCCFWCEECIMLLYLKVIIDTLWLLYLSVIGSFHLMAVVLWVLCLFSVHQPMIKSRSWHWIHTQMYIIAISCILACTYTHTSTHTNRDIKIHICATWNRHRIHQKPALCMQVDYYL